VVELLLGLVGWRSRGVSAYTQVRNLALLTAIVFMCTGIGGITVTNGDSTLSGNLLVSGIAEFDGLSIFNGAASLSSSLSVGPS
jgi:hypothetical protein